MSNTPMRADAQSAPAEGIKIQINGVYKVFGRNEAKALQMLRQGADKSTVQAETGASVGLAGVDAQIPQARSPASWACRGREIHAGAAPEPADRSLGGRDSD